MSIRKKKFELSPRLKLGICRDHSKSHILKIAAISCLILAVVLTFNAFRLIFNSNHAVSLDQLSPQVLGATDIKTPPPADSGNQVRFVEYTVLKGDTLFNISQKFNISWSTLSTINSLKSPFTLKPGQVIRIPK